MRIISKASWPFVVLVCLSLSIPTPAHADDLEAMKGKLHGDHSWMMWATASVLSDEERAYLAPELELLIEHYTHLPDMNWSNSGTWGGWSGLPDAGWSPDVRREWGISQACDWSPVSRQGHQVHLHSPPGTYEASRTLYPKAIELLKLGRHGDAIRMFGAVFHSIQDSATFPRMQAIHRASKFAYEKTRITGYQPQILSDTPEEVGEALVKRVEGMVHFVETVALELRQAILEDDLERYNELRVRCTNEAAKVVTDALHTAIALAGPRPAYVAPAANKNLVTNANVEEEDFWEPWPEGWVGAHGDKQDRVGRIEWEGLAIRNGNVYHSGRHSLKLMWAGTQGLEWRQTWPAASFVRPGQRYRASAWVRTAQATGESFVVLQFSDAAAQLVQEVKSTAIQGDHDWTQLAAEADVPEGAVRVRVILRSVENEGATWFDDIALHRLESVPTAEGVPASQSAPRTEDRVLRFTFNETSGVHVNDHSPYAALNGPNMTFSAGIPAELHAQDDQRGAVISFDGIDDFLECPASHIQDMHAPEGAMTLMLWVRNTGEAQDAVLVQKEQRPRDGKARGYRLSLNEGGNVQWTVHTESGPVIAVSKAAIPGNQWVHIAAVSVPGESLMIYIDGVLQGTAELKDKVLRPRKARVGAPPALYLGANTGVRDFFQGQFDDLILLNRALAPDEIVTYAEQSN